VVLVALFAVVAGVAALSRGEDAKPRQPAPSAGSQRFGDDADLMRRLERKKLVGAQR
jgi:hypothetical protein